MNWHPTAIPRRRIRLLIRSLLTHFRSSARRHPRRTLILAGVVLLASIWGLAAFSVGWRAAPFVNADLVAAPHHSVALVLGTSPTLPDGRPNRFFTTRIHAAAALFKAHKVEHLIVSGDNGSRGYDEPTAMRRALIAQGVPSANITRDFAGFRTLDSILRAKLVFGVERMLIVSQRFHAERAVFLARSHGIDARGFAAPDVGGPEGLRVLAREVGSRLMAVLDVYILRTQPRFTGPRVPLDGTS